MFTPSVTLYIDKDNSRVRIVDTTDLSAVNLATVGIVGSGTITSPTGDVLATGVTINRSTGATTSAWVNLDVDSAGAIINGTYSLVYEYTYTVTNYAISAVNSSNGIVLSAVDWSNLFVAGNSVTIASSSLSGNNGVKTVVSAAFNANTTITVSQTLTAGVLGTGTLSFTITTSGFVSNTYVWSGCDVVTPTVSVSYDCDSTQFGTITFSDTTVLPSGQTLTTREFIVAFPQLLTDPATPANQTTSLPAITIDTLATGDWVSRLNYTVAGTQSDGLTFGYTATSGAQTTTVTCEGSLCSMSQCIVDLINTNKTALETTGQSAYLAATVTITGLVAIANEQRRCGDMDAYRTTVASIRTILDSTGCNCDCCNDTTGNHWINNATFDGQNSLDVLQEEIDALTEIVNALSNSTFPLAEATNIAMSDFSESGLKTIIVPAALFTSGKAYLKIKIAFGRSLPLTGSNTVLVTNTTTGQTVCEFSILDGDNFKSSEATIDLYTVNTFFNTSIVSVLNDAGATSLEGGVNQLASNVFNTGIANVLSFIATDTSAGNYITSVDVVGYIKP